jgi:hypothetical protein
MEAASRAQPLMAPKYTPPKNVAKRQGQQQPLTESPKWFILSYMDHFEVLREKIGSLRAEIAQIQELNQHYRLHHRADTEAQIAHGQRQERLQAIQQELARLANLGRKVQSIEEVKEKHRPSLHLVKKVS